MASTTWETYEESFTVSDRDSYRDLRSTNNPTGGACALVAAAGGEVMVVYDKVTSEQLIKWARRVGLGGGRIQDIADQLEAAGREVERLDTAAASSDAGARWHAADNKRLVAERDSLRSEVHKLGEDTGDLIAQRDSLRQQLEAAQRSDSLVSASLESALAELEIIQGRYKKIRHNARTFCDGFLTIPQPGQHRDRCLPGSGCERMGCPASLQRHDLAVAQQRIAEMEAETSRAVAIHNDEAKHSCDLRATLRAIYPVYRAAIGWHYNRNSAAVLSEEVVRQHVASSEPDILAALKAAGLELP